MDKDDIQALKDFWEKHANRDPMWAILADPSKKDRKWNVRDFFETGQKEISILLFYLESLKIDFGRGQALDFGCGIGRLTQALAAYFDRVAGVDISETMIRLANLYNRFPARVRYVCNPHDHLKAFADHEFDFIYTTIVLQHLCPELVFKYFEEFRRVLGLGGLLIFQLPSHLREQAILGASAAPASDDVYQSSLRLESIPASPRTPSTEIKLQVYVKNASRHDWVQVEAAPIRLGNHWLSGDGKNMLVQDDGRADLPPVIRAGEEIPVSLTVKTPLRDGDYRCELDLAHEGIYWFKDKGALTMSFPLQVRSGKGESRTEPSARYAGTLPADSRDFVLPEDIYRHLRADPEEPGDFPMNGIPKDQVVDFFQSRGDAIIRIEDDEHGGKEWIGFRYFVRRSSL
jgi:SAM-dependent methyltransferase